MKSSLSLCHAEPGEASVHGRGFLAALGMTKALLICLLLSACGGTTAPASSAPAAAPSSAAAKAAASTSPAASAKPAGSAAAPASAKPAASGAAATSAKPAASESPLPAPKPGAVTIAIVGTSPSQTPIWIAADTGLFDKYGAPVQLFTTTAPVAMAALLKGDVQVAVDGGAMIGFDPPGTKLAFVGAQQNAFNQFDVYAKPAIKSLQELKGKTVGAASPGSAATVAFEIILKSAGMDPKKDVQWVYLGTPAAQWTALSNGQVDGGINAWPFA